jgi:outer membrane biosynthesis protein TonB
VTTGRYRRSNASFRPTGARRSDRENNFFLGMVGFSLLVHVIVAAIFSHTPTATNNRRPPTLYVDLVMPPVANPQRGNAGATVKTAAPAVTIPQPTVAPTKVAKPPVVVKEKETKKTAVVKDDVDIAADIAKMKERKAAQDEQREIQAAIAAMKKTTPTPPAAAAAVGSASGTGDEAGSAIDEWLQRAVKEKWTWTDRKKKDLSAEVEVEFDATGKLSNYRFIRSSRDARFDDSLKRALLSLEPLPTLRKYKATILFNLDDLQG